MRLQQCGLGVLLGLALVACASAAGVQSLQEDHQASLEAMRGDLDQAWKQRDEALAQVKEMEKVLTKKCGAEVGESAAASAKLAAKKLAAKKQEGAVKRDQQAAKKEAQLADAAMSTAQTAAKKKKEIKNQLNKAKLELRMLEKKATILKDKVKSDKAAAAKAVDAKDGIKAAAATESVAFGKAKDAEVKVAAAREKVQQLKAKLAAMGPVAEAQLSAATKDTQNAAAKVSEAMKAQAEAAKNKQEVAQERYRIVQMEEQQLKKQAEELHRQIVVAQLKTKRAMSALTQTKSSETTALDGAQVPCDQLPKGAVAEAQAQVIAEQDKSTYATTMKNIEAILIKSRSEIEEANADKKRTQTKLSELEAQLTKEQDLIQKTKLKKKKAGLEGALEEADSRIKKAKTKHAKAEKRQQNAIRRVISDIVMDDKSQKTKDTNENEDGEGVVMMTL